MKITEMYGKNPVYARRAQTDKLFILPAGSTKFHGLFDDAIKFVSENHCKNRELWKVFVDQFRSDVDSAGHTWRGEYWGKMMRGAAFTYAYTKDPELYSILEETVRDLLTTPDEHGRISSYGIDHELVGWDMWGRKYVLLGLQYFMDICKDSLLKEHIIAAMCGHLDYIISKVGPESEGKIPVAKTSEALLGINSCSILEPVVRLYCITGKKEYLDFADHIVETGCADAPENLYELAYENKLRPYEYPVTKAYEMMSCFEGLVEYYRVTGIEKWRIAATNFAKSISKTDITVIGCSGCTHELFDHSSLKQTYTKNLEIIQETCVTVTWMKYLSQVLALAGDAEFVDEIERSLYNGFLGAINTENSDMMYGYAFDSYSPLLFATRGRRMGGPQFMNDCKVLFGCCVAIGAAGTGLIPSVATMLRKDGVALNLYSEGAVKAVTPSGKKLGIRTKTAYPYDGSVDVTLSLANAEKFTLALHIPYWSKKTEIKVNGESVRVRKGYTEITRKWSDGDRVTLSFDMRVRILTAQNDPDDANAKFHNALISGPVLLARDKRLGEDIDGVVNFAKDKDGYAVVKESHTANFPTEIELEVFMKDGSSIHVADYASCGKTWKRDSIMTAWMPTKQYWKVNFNKPVALVLGVPRKYFVAKDGDVTLGENRDMWKIEKCGFYVRLKNIATGKYLALAKNDGVVTSALADKQESDYQKWNLNHMVANRYTLENKMLGLQLYYEAHTDRVLKEKPFSEHEFLQADCWREFIIEN